MACGILTPMSRDYALLSIIVPMYNEEEVLTHFFDALWPILTATQKRFEVLCINDGSSDTTLTQLLRFQQHHPEIKIIDFVKNFGKEAALSAGLEYAKGDIVIPVDADLQDPPGLIPQLIDHWRQGYDEVVAIRASRQSDTFLKRMTANLFYKFFNKISETKIHQSAGDFRLLDRSLVDILKKLPEKKRFMKGLYGWVGSTKQATVTFYREVRVEGTSKWNYWKLWNFALDGITSFSSLPLRVWSYVGAIISLIAMLYMVFIFIKTLILGADVNGYPSIMCCILFFGGIQLLSLGILGEYIARIYTESKNRPLYLVRDVHTHETSLSTQLQTENTPC